MLAEDKPKTRESLIVQSVPPIATPSIDTPTIAKVGPLVLPPPVITWEKLPADFILPDDPVDNIHQPSIAAGITESLLLADLLPEDSLTCTDYGIIATVDGKTIAKAPDWAYIAHITSSIHEVDRSYTPHLDGDVPTIVLEFLSATDGTEYSIKPANPMGKWYFYERVLKVPYYGIFEPISGDFQVYKLGETGSYARLPIEESGRYWIEPMKLSIAAWKGKRQNRMGYWLRWWDASGNILPWANELKEQQEAALDQQQATIEQQQVALEEKQITIEQQQAELDQQQVDLEQARERADRLAAQLKALGLEPE
jgi:Putative restriction endonuclease